MITCSTAGSSRKVQLRQRVVVDPVDDEPHLCLHPAHDTEAVRKKSREEVAQAAVEQKIRALAVPAAAVDVLDHDEGVLGLPVDGVVEGQEGVAEEAVLLVEQYRGLVRGQHVQVADLDVGVKVVALHVVEEELEQQGRDAVATKLAVHAEREDVRDRRRLGGLDGVARENHAVVLGERRPRLELGHENANYRELVHGRYADEALGCGDVDVPKK
jgi:hypothetical protein